MPSPSADGQVTRRIPLLAVVVVLMPRIWAVERSRPLRPKDPGLRNSRGRRWVSRRDVTADVDVRGTLVVDRQVPVGFQKMQCRVDIHADTGTDSKMLERLLAAAEHSCVNLQTLRAGVAVETSFHGGEPGQ